MKKAADVISSDLTGERLTRNIPEADRLQHRTRFLDLHLVYESRSRQGRALEDWLRAEQELLHRYA
jgi:DUF2934 family protein